MIAHGPAPQFINFAAWNGPYLQYQFHALFSVCRYKSRICLQIKLKANTVENQKYLLNDTYILNVCVCLRWHTNNKRCLNRNGGKMHWIANQSPSHLPWIHRTLFVLLIQINFRWKMHKYGFSAQDWWFDEENYSICRWPFTSIPTKVYNILLTLMSDSILCNGSLVCTANENSIFEQSVRLFWLIRRGIDDDAHWNTESNWKIASAQVDSYDMMMAVGIGKSVTPRWWID